MSAATLRRAAALMRERARAATDGGHGWRSTGDERLCEVWAPRDAANYDAFMVATTLTRLNPNPSASAQADAEHIASWSPGVALFVAEWLDQAADWRDEHPGEVDDDPDLAETKDPALVFARAYLGIADA